MAYSCTQQKKKKNLTQTKYDEYAIILVLYVYWPPKFKS